ncbi:glycosyltransferase [Rhizobium rosettiformans]|uniref:glycosyltransferase n=1 Tax=Rhizobium rosettiformans TaxID=1368430 RepID=UPI00285B6EDF|nr:glycosyltransferase [Rhizobium rosettiformans]MDR7029000.1 glycosyltransferase involved in cell wall biosynthesis [Rhizobium rosettiformans]MDR7063718.1 glycosyltransferase involved in cell wall biosynthesis [Rhizobium rosettiformans]
MHTTQQSVDIGPLIVHFTTVHPRNDTRIRLKEVASLAQIWPEQVAIFVQDGKGDEVDVDGYFSIHDTGAPERGRLRRMTIGAWRMYSAVRAARPEIAHFHDPELLPWAVLLRLSGIQVIYDAHEDLPAATLSKPYINRGMRKPLASVIALVEGFFAKLCTRIVVATPSIGQNLSSLKPRLVQNFPLLAELQGGDIARNVPAPQHFAYVGGITRIRAAVEMVQAVGLVADETVRLQMAGTFTANLGEELEQTQGWKRVDLHGWADRAKVATILAECRAGLVLYYPEPNHIRAQPNKLFEYMSASLPVIASDFPLWREIVDGARCGLLVNPKDPRAIADAMQWIIDHPAEATEMGRRGREAIEQRYNWEAESESLIDLYRNLLPAN